LHAEASRIVASEANKRRLGVQQATTRSPTDDASAVYSERMVTGESECLFCRIVAGEIPADVVHRSDSVVGFRDVAPQAPVHVLFVPSAHFENAAALAEAAPAVTAELMTAAAAIAEAEGLDGHYRLVFNTGTGVGQSVFHAHLHLLGGRSMGWPPG
jgi:histidine triad (HIT) family protein